MREAVCLAAVVREKLAIYLHAKFILKTSILYGVM